MPSVQIIGSDTLSSALIEEARKRLMAIGSHPILCTSAREPMRGDPAALAALLSDASYEEAVVASARESTFEFTLSATMPTYDDYSLPAPRKKDSTHVPFYKSLPKFRRR